MHSIDGFLGGLTFFEGHVSLVCEIFTSLSSTLNMSRLDLTKLIKHSFQTLVVGASGQSLDKDVQEAALATRALLAALMSEHFDFLAV